MLVPANRAGESGKCKSCKHTVVVPEVRAVLVPAAVAAKPRRMKYFLLTLGVLFVIGSIVSPTDSGNAHDDLTAFQLTLDIHELDNLVLSSSATGKHLTVSVDDVWNSYSYDERLQMATGLHTIWFSIAAINGSETQLTIKDTHGNRIGGQDSLFGVWVDK